MRPRAYPASVSGSTLSLRARRVRIGAIRATLTRRGTAAMLREHLTEVAPPHRSGVSSARSGLPDATV